jgi:uncharacterized protein (DUF58 family)
MRIAFIPSRLFAAVLLGSSFAVLGLIVLGMSVRMASWIAAGVFVCLLLLMCADFTMTRRRWRAGQPTLQRQLPAAFAVGVRSSVPFRVLFGEAGVRHEAWQLTVYDRADSTLAHYGMPATVSIEAGDKRKSVELTYPVVPTVRGEVVFSSADVRIRSRLRLCEVLDRLGESETLRVFPDFSQVARYAWLAGDRRLAEIGIKTFRQRGEGTDFKQLSEYRMGDSVRHIDWKATSRLGKPIVREFQNERDQSVLLLIDCGRRMRSDERDQSLGLSHFDQVLNATMLLTYVALKQGDAVGAYTFGTPPSQQRWIPPKKGLATLNSMMSELYAVQATPTHSDYLSAAKDVLRRQRKRSLIIVISNFRDEDTPELRQALTLLRTRHLVLTASLRERVISQLISQPLKTRESLVEVASAHLHEQTRRDAFNGIAAKDGLAVDAEPDRLSIDLVNRYNAIKRAGLV